MLVIAHLSDPHLDGNPAAGQRLRRVTDYVRSLSRPVDVVLVTGDLADHGTPDEYAEVAAALDFDVPVLVLPGNHDVSAPLRAGLSAFLESSDSDGHPVHQVRDVAGARFVLLDSSVSGEDLGRFSQESLDWLDRALADPPADGPLFVALHHPPVEVGHPVLDGWMLQDADGLAEVLRGAPAVTALLAGHVHGAVVSSFAGLPLLVAPGIRSTVPLPFEPRGERLLDVTAPPGLAFHLYEPAQGLRTHYRYLP